jgi:hypothetical protein
MHVVVTAACFLAAVLTTFLRGAGSAFAFLYLPALLLLSEAKAVELPGLPDAQPPQACIYGILVGGLLGGRWPRLRPCAVDYIIVLLLLEYILSTLLTESPYAAVSVFGSMCLWLVVPYFVVRCTLEEKRTQREALFALIAAIAVIGVYALIEFRLWPHIFLLQLDKLGIGDFTGGYAHRRFGFFRAVASFGHPIDLGISAALVLAIIFILATRSGITTRNAWVRLGLGMALAAMLASASFTPYMGLLGGLSLYLVLWTVPPTRRLLTLGVAILIGLAFAYTAYLAHAPLPEQPVSGSALEGSRWTRHDVIKQAWEPAATAGAFGRGIEATGELEIKGFDNAYLLITSQRGFLGLGLWLALPLFLAAMVSQSLGRPRSRNLARSILAGFCASIGTMVAMFTVWLGFVYASLLPVMLALTVNAARAPAAVRRASSRPASPPPPSLGRDPDSIRREHDLAIDRARGSRFLANQLRVLLTAAVYVLMQEIRVERALCQRFLNRPD